MQCNSTNYQLAPRLALRTYRSLEYIRLSAHIKRLNSHQQTMKLLLLRAPTIAAIVALTFSADASPPICKEQCRTPGVIAQIVGDNTNSNLGAFHYGKYCGWGNFQTFNTPDEIRGPAREPGCNPIDDACREHDDCSLNPAVTNCECQGTFILELDDAIDAGCDVGADELCESEKCDYIDTATAIKCTSCQVYAGLGCTGEDVLAGVESACPTDCS